MTFLKMTAMSLFKMLLHHRLKKGAHLLEHSSLIDFLSSDVTNFQDAQGKGFEGWLLNQVRVMDVQTGEHSLCQRMTLQPCDLYIDTIKKTSTET